MGIYDRPYLQEEEGTSGWSSGRSMVVNLIIANVVVWVGSAVFFDDQLNEWLSLKSNLLRQPWQAWQLLTYGFCHADAMHILFNMIFLWVFGSAVEGIYGRAEFLRFYLVAIVLAGLAWMAMTAAQAGAEAPPAQLVGASGGVMGLMALFVLHFPRRLLYIWGVLPVPAWALGTLYVLIDVFGTLHGTDSRVANVAHLGGALWGLVYFRTKIHLGRFVPRRLSDLKGASFRPKLRIHDPDQEVRDLGRQVDSILEKISREGEASLTKKERHTLEEASRRYQRRRQ